MKIFLPQSGKAADLLQPLSHKQFLFSIHLEELKKMANPFMKLGISNVACSVKAEAENLGLSLSQRTSKIRERSLKIVTRSFNKIGLVVPYDKK